MKPLDALDILERLVTAYERKAVAENPEAMASVKRAEEFERTEASKRQTMILVHAQAQDSQALGKRVDRTFFILKDLNWDRSEVALQGPCIYFSLDEGDITFGVTGKSLVKRHKDRKNGDRIIANRILVIPVLDLPEAKVLEKRWKRFCANFRIGRRERMRADWPAFMDAATAWNGVAERDELCILVPMLSRGIVN